MPGIGTAYTIKPSKIMVANAELADKYGSVYVHELPGQPLKYMISSYDLVNEISDEKRFHKLVHPVIDEVREFGGNGLFTAYTEEPEWEQAHRILMPAFNPAALESMYNDMADIAEQLALKWARTRSDVGIDVAEDFTRLTLETIALCSFSYRFNAFYSESLHPFVAAMADGLERSGVRAYIPEKVRRLDVVGNRKFNEDVRIMEETVDALIAERERNANAEGRLDVLDVMLDAADPKTGEKLTKENLRYQLVTFLIAGHETTSGLLSFALWELLKNPQVMDKARRTVDEVLGGRFPEFGDIKKLSYIDQILREALRMYPPLPGYAVTPYEKTVVGANRGEGESFEVEPGETLFVMLSKLHRDPAVWENPDTFDPERFSFENSQHIPHNAWKPFGNGQRSCIGRQFAMQEATMVLALLVQHFDFALDDPDYDLELLDGLTWKPANFRVNVTPRKGKEFTGRGNADHTGTKLAVTFGTEDLEPENPNGKRINIGYGSNAGTSLAFARQLARWSVADGYEVNLDTLDSFRGNIPAGEPFLVCTSSYEGKPTDDAQEFVAWLEEQSDSDLLSETPFAVFGNGNSEWASTFHKVPRYIDERLAALGANRICPIGVADVRKDYEGAFDQWSRSLWGQLGDHTGIEHVAHLQPESVEVQVTESDRAQLLGNPDNPLRLGEVVDNQLLSDANDESGSGKHTITIRLPEKMSFATGDYLEVLPYNPAGVVKRALKYFAVRPDTHIEVRGNSDFLPAGATVTAQELFSGYLDLGAPAPRAAVEALAGRCQCPPEAAKLKAMATDEGYGEQVFGTRMTLLDLLETNPSVSLDLDEFLGYTRPLATRRYSISSASEVDAHVARLTYSSTSQPAWSGNGQFESVCGSYLSGLQPGDTVAVAVVEGSEYFRPALAEGERMLMLGAGTGIAPFRGFLEAAANSGRVPAQPHVLYFGCRHPETDFLYSEQLQQWQSDGIVELRPAFSRQEEGGVRYVQHAIWRDRAEIAQMIQYGVSIYVCGSADTLAAGVRQTLLEIFASEFGDSEQQAAQRLLDLQSAHRYLIDVFD